MMQGWTGSTVNRAHASITSRLLRNGCAVGFMLTAVLPVAADHAADDAQQYRECINKHLAQKFSAKMAHKKCFKTREATGAGKKAKGKPSPGADKHK